MSEAAVSTLLVGRGPTLQGTYLETEQLGCQVDTHLGLLETVETFPKWLHLFQYVSSQGSALTDTW